GLEADNSESSEGDKDQIESVKKKSPEENYIAALKEASEKLLSLRGAESLAKHGGSIIDVIEEAVGKYFESEATKDKATGGGSNTTDSGSSEQMSSSSQPGETSTSFELRTKLNKSPAASIDTSLSDTAEDEPLNMDLSDDSSVSQDKTFSLSDDE